MRRVLKSLLLVVGCLTFLVGCPKGGDLPSPGPEPTPVVVTPDPAPGYVPSAEMQTIVASLVPLTDAAMARYCGDFADLLARDSEIVTTTGAIKAANEKAGQLVFQKTGRVSNPTMGAAMSDAVKKAIGDDNVKLTPELDTRAVEVFKAMEWALR